MGQRSAKMLLAYGVGLLLAFSMVSAWSMTVNEHQGESFVSLNTSVEFSYEHDGVSAMAQFDYSWTSHSSPQFNSSIQGSVGCISWDSLQSVAVTTSSDSVSEALSRYFSEARIDRTEVRAYLDGSWEATVAIQLYQDLHLTLVIDGDNSSVKSVTPTIDATLFPESLKAALRGLGLNWLDISLVASFSINWDFVRDLIYHFFDNIIKGLQWIIYQLKEVFLCRIEL